MNRTWRALAGALVLSGAAIWLPLAVSSSAASGGNPASTVVRSPAADNGDNGSGDNGNGNGNDNTGSGSNGATAMINDTSYRNINVGRNNVVYNSTAGTAIATYVVPPFGELIGGHEQNGALSVDLNRSPETPGMNIPFQIAVTGDGAPIAQVSWWAEGSGSHGGSTNDDLARVGTLTFPCNGTQPCSASWTLVARTHGVYTIHAGARDTAGNEVQTSWQVTVP